MTYNNKSPLRRLPYEVYHPPQSHDTYLDGAFQQGVLNMPEESTGAEDIHQVYELPQSLQVLLKILPMPFDDTVLKRQLSLTRQGDDYKGVPLQSVLPSDMVAGLAFRVLGTDAVFPEKTSLKIPSLFQGGLLTENVHITQTQMGENVWSSQCSLSAQPLDYRTPYIPCGVRVGSDGTFKHVEAVAFTLAAGLSLETAVLFKNVKDLEPQKELLIGQGSQGKDLHAFISQGGLEGSIPFDEDDVLYISDKVINQEGDTLWVNMVRG